MSNLPQRNPGASNPPNAPEPHAGTGGQSNVGAHQDNRPLPTEGDGTDMIQVTDGGGGLPDEIQVPKQ